MDFTSSDGQGACIHSDSRYLDVILFSDNLHTQHFSHEDSVNTWALMHLLYVLCLVVPLVVIVVVVVVVKVVVVVVLF